MNVAVYIGAALFALLVFPFHLYNYVYINTEEKYASLNVGVYGINFYNLNTVKNRPGEMQVNGKNKKVDVKSVNVNTYKIFNQLCLYKIVQLGDYGVRKDANIYIAFGQNCFTTAIYKFVQMNGNFCKLRNYTILNEEHDDIRYYAKAVTVVNAVVVLKIIYILLKGKLHEHKK